MAGNFSVEAVLKFREDRCASIDKEQVLNNITISPVDQKDPKKGIRAVVKVVADDIPEAEKFALEQLEHVTSAFSSSGIGVRIEDVESHRLPETSQKVVNGIQNIIITEFVTITERVSLSIGLQGNNLVDWTTGISKLSDQERMIFLRILGFYNRSLLETDDVNRFIFLWTMLEGWKTYKFGPSEDRSHKRKMLKTLSDYGYEGNPEDAYRVRVEAFHDGQTKNVVNTITGIQRCAEQVVFEIRNSIGIK